MIPFATNFSYMAASKEITNLIVGNVDKIESLLENSSFAGQKVSMITANNFTAVNMNWSQFSQGAYRVMAEGGQLRLGLHGMSPETINNTIIPALRNAGFTNVNLYGNFVTGVR
jgi:hypothetical protein